MIKKKVMVMGKIFTGLIFMHLSHRTMFKTVLKTKVIFASVTYLIQNVKVVNLKLFYFFLITTGEKSQFTTLQYEK